MTLFDKLHPVTITRTPVRKPVVTITARVGLSDGEIHETTFGFDPANPAEGVQQVARWFRRQTDNPDALEAAKNVMIDKICTELPNTDYELIEALWNEATK